MEKQTDVKLLRNGIRRQLILPAVRDTLRDKQVEAFEALISPDFTDEQISHSYFKLPTGFGKTVMFSHMARAYFDAIRATGAKRQKIIIIVPRLSLIEQTQQKLARFADITATEFSGRTKDANSDVIITTYNSLTKLFGVVDFNDVGLIFADEAHHMLGGKIAEKLEFYNKYVPIIGFTATPEYEANRAVANMLNTEIYAMGIPDAVRSGVLNPVKNVLYRSSIVCDLANVPAQTSGEYDWSKIKISPDTLATEIARIYADGADENTGIEFRNLRAIINCPNTQIAELQAQKINETMDRDVAIALHKEGINDKKFDRLQKEFVSGRYSVACQVNTLTEGFDDVTVAMCINYPTRSRVRAEQAAGRAIRIDENNPDKIAFVVDTIFRATADEKAEDILYTASNSKQVLFKDIAGDMVLYPENFRAAASRTGARSPRERGKVEFVDFDLITDTATLVDLKRKADERIADENIPEKTDEWQSANDLVTDKTFPMGDYGKIKKALEEYQTQKPEWIQIRKPSAGSASLCLHRDGRQWLLDTLGIKYVPPKTEEWQSANDLARDETFPTAKPANIKKALEEHQHEKPEWIRYLKSKTGQIVLCLHRDGRQWLLDTLGIKDFPPKTAEWQSADDLAKDKTFPIGNLNNINKALKEHQHEKPEWIQIRKSGARTPLCLHRDGRQWLLDTLGIKYVPPKTEEWQSANDLARDETFPTAKSANIKKALEEHQHEKPEWIQMRKSGPKTSLCLHRDGRDWLLDTLGIKHVPPKTDEWQSANDLARDETFPMTRYDNIQKALEEHRTEKPKWIQIRKSGARTPLCLHRDGRQWLLERIAQEKQAKKKSIQRAATVLGAGANVIDTTATIKSTTTDKIKKK